MTDVFEYLDLLKISLTSLPTKWGRHVGSAPDNAPVPYIVLGSSGVERVGDHGNSRDTTNVMMLRVTATAATLAGAGDIGRQVKQLIAPDPDDNPSVGGARIVWVSTDYLGLDNDVTMPGTTTHPAYRVDSYLVTLP